MSEAREGVHDLEISLISGQGVCAAKHTVGEKWIWSGSSEQLWLEKGICVHALASMLPKLVAMRYGATLPWLKSNPDTATHLCPDVSSPHVFQIQRVRKP